MLISCQFQTVLALQGELITKNQDLLAAQSNVNHLQTDFSVLRSEFEQALTRQSQERERMTLLENQIRDEQHKLAATLEAQQRTFQDAERCIEEECTKWEAELERRQSELDERTRRQEASLNTRSAEYNERMKKLEQESALLAKERDLLEKTRNEIEAERLKMHARLRERDLSQQLSVSTTPRSKSSVSVPDPAPAPSSSPAPPPAPAIGPVHTPARALSSSPAPLDPTLGPDNNGSVANFARGIARPPRNDDDDEEEVSSLLHASDADDSMDDDNPAPPPRLRKGKHVHVNSGGSRPPPQGHSASSIIHDDDADVSMHDDEPAPLSRMYKAGNAHVSVDGGKPCKRKNLPEKIDVNVPTPTQRLQYMAILRELFRTEYNLTSDMDWYRFIPATKDEMDEYEREQGVGPCSVTRPYIDPGWRTCRWNKTIFGFVLQDFISQCTSRGMSTDDEGYLYALIVDKCDRGFQTWRKMRPKPGEDIPANIARNAREYTEGLEKARTQANRRNKHGRRVTTTDRCAQQNTAGPLQGNLRTAVATYLQVGGDACMSSEDDCIDRVGTRMRRKKILPWRPEEVNYAMLTTDSMRTRPGVFSNRGAIPTMSIQGFKTSDRSPPRGLPISFYDPQWYDALSEYQKEVLGAIPGGRYNWIFETFRRSRR
ncbi:hypothetical protein TRAPUB_3989 [Trametes pubescens]|uniref:Uncharacterized protein n=1 Tax=Trametes pubescens TaxID=154538 RepID=A0A1M2VCA4_TRAPU|nr:hypothetical protein TRAPUB_3989 [Trametes pubescens]